MTKPVDALLALAERCEAATGPDRELDRIIALNLGWRSVAKGWVRDPGGNSKDELPRYTASLDAAITLVPNDHAFRIDNGPCHWICLGKQKPMGRADVHYPKPRYDGDGDSWLTVSANADTLALALGAAALRARAASGETP